MNRTSSRCLLIASALVASLAASPRPASACGDEFVPAIDHRVMGVARAEQAMQEGKYVAAAGMVLRMFPDIQGRAATDPVAGRALRTLALASVRAGGVLPIGSQVPRELRGTWAGATAEDRTRNLEWAVGAMQRVSDTRKDDPAVQSDLGEALARLDGQKGPAKKLLAELAEKDLLASPEGYAALARLHAEAGDAGGRDAAAKRCEAMAKSPDVCRIPAVGGGQS
jgi:hypothetical protein